MSSSLHATNFSLCGTLFKIFCYWFLLFVFCIQSRKNWWIDRPDGGIQLNNKTNTSWWSACAKGKQWQYQDLIFPCMLMSLQCQGRLSLGTRQLWIDILICGVWHKKSRCLARQSHIYVTCVLLGIVLATQPVYIYCKVSK